VPPPFPRPPPSCSPLPSAVSSPATHRPSKRRRPSRPCLVAVQSAQEVGAVSFTPAAAGNGTEESHWGGPGKGGGRGALEHDVAAVHLEVVRRDVPAAAPRRNNRSGAVRCHGSCACSGGTSAEQAAAAGDSGCASTTQQSTPTADVNPRPWLGRQRPQVHLSTARPGQAQHLAVRRRHRALHPVEGAGAPGLCDQKCHQAMLAVRRRWLRAAVRPPNGCVQVTRGKKTLDLAIENYWV
jgi:hypothetical protein